MVHTDKGGGQFPSACAHKKRRASVTRIVYVCIITIRVKNGRGTRAVAQGELLREGGVPIFLFALSLSRRRRRHKIGFANPQKTKRKKGLNVRNSPTPRSLSLSRVRRYCFSPSQHLCGGIFSVQRGEGEGGEYWIFLPVNQLGAGEGGAGKGTIAKEERKKFTYPLLS